MSTIDIVKAAESRKYTEFEDLAKEILTAKLAENTKMNDAQAELDVLNVEIVESPVGIVGRTGAADAKAHVGADLRAEFKKIVRKIGGKTVARQLLAEMNAGGPLGEELKTTED